MASDTKNVKLGICTLFYKGKDLGYTQGGVTVTVQTNTHKVNVDQFGQSAINETIMSRDVTIKAPLAETTLDNLVATMPGATLVETGGVAAAGSVTFNSVPVEGDKLTVNGTAFTFKAAPVAATDILIEGTASAQATQVASVLSASADANVSACTYAAVGAVVNVTAKTAGTAGNSITLAETGGELSVSGATLTGGVDAKKSVVVTNGVGVDLLSVAGELRLHPLAKPADDYSEDFVIPLAATAGGMNYVYQVDKERVFDTTFTGYPDPVTKELFAVGSAPAA
ncbi:hypothetical protein [Burkholderia vietnamiensis]|uniref:hypothetical protein n=1 Tax=Burkholderia vietnamiensis TaxID=60552 RepID=UPI001CAD3ECE|nr:hypothetical protein [Burkholderia vietnamiensis]CAG9228870.1 conserved hypothetical protein [Burkholderia vietnamiensis]HDR9086358.1 hypothetical protein [Burkholderia vietnamiensis]